MWGPQDPQLQEQQDGHLILNLNHPIHDFKKDGRMTMVALDIGLGIRWLAFSKG